MDTLIDLFANTQAALYESVMQPIAFAVGLGNRLEDVRGSEHEAHIWARSANAFESIDVSGLLQKTENWRC